MSRAGRVLASALVIICAAASCSTTRVLREDQYRLAKNKVVFEGNPNGLSSSDVSAYIRQQPSSSSFFSWVYNWSNPDKNDWWNESLRKVGVAPVVFNKSQIPSSCENIKRHLDYLGYYHSEVETYIDTIGKNVKVTYYVTPGNRVKIDSIIYKVPEGEFADEFDSDRKNFLVKKGDWLSEKTLEAESERGASFFRDRGYYNFSKFNYFFEADTLGPRNVLTYEIRNYTRNELESYATPLKKYHIGKVDVTLAKSVPFREKLLQDLNIIHNGDLYSESKVNTNYQRYSSLKLFNTVNIEMAPADSSTVDCHITLGQGKMKGVKLNMEASINSNNLFGLSPAVSFYNKNIFKGGELLSLGFSGNFQRQFGTDVQANEFGVNGSLSFPRLLGLSYQAFKGANIPKTQIQGSFNYQNRPEFIRYLANFSYGYTGGTDRVYYQFNPLSVSVVKVDNMTEAFMMQLIKNMALYDMFSDHIDAGINGQIYWTTDASVIPQKSYTYARLAVDLSGNVVHLFDKWLPEDEFGQHMLFGMPYSRYVRAELNTGHTFRFSPSSALAVHFVGGVSKGLNGDWDTAPFEKQFYVGGASSMRGWQVRTLGPGASDLYSFFTIASQVGEYKLEMDLEYRQKLFWKLEGALFAEAGNVWDYEDLWEADEWIETFGLDWGLGLRLNLGFILLRLDWGMKVYEPCRNGKDRWIMPYEWLRSGGSSLHFGVGYPF